MTAVSFEVFPPRSLDASFQLWDTVHGLTPLEPRFISITYGAGGSTRDLTQEAAATLRRQSGLPVAAHLTCAGATRAEIDATVAAYREAGVRDIVALRGDPVGGADRFVAPRDGYADSVELVAALAKRGGFNIRVGAYPEMHPDSASAGQNIDWLKAKLDAGASEAITQFFFDAETFLRFRDACDAAGITAPITPGILPVTNWTRTKGFAARCGASVPQQLARAFEKAERDDRMALFGLAHATELCDRLIVEGVSALHFYTLNRADMTRDICRALGIGAQTSVRDVA